MIKFLYLIGEPGAGKTTLTKSLFPGFSYVENKPFCRTVHEDDLIELGYERGTFSGTDALSLSVQPIVLKWLNETPFNATARMFAEGDRLGNAKFFNAVIAGGRFDLKIAFLKAYDNTLKSRRENRGSKQSETWLKGRKTKILNLLDVYQDRIIYLQAEDDFTSNRARLDWFFDR